MNASRESGIARWSLRALLVSVAVCALSWPAIAELGGGLDSVKADQAHMQAKRQVTQAEAFAVHEMQAPSGIVVREYAASSGTVFGVTWDGPFIPNLKQLLGDQHFAEYQQALQDRGPHRGPVNIQLPGLVIQMTGHQRSFHGRAYLPDQVPQGVQAEAIR
jgi:hypothetical protein